MKQTNPKISVEVGGVRYVLVDFKTEFTLQQVRRATDIINNKLRGTASNAALWGHIRLLIDGGYFDDVKKPDGTIVKGEQIPDSYIISWIVEDISGMHAGADEESKPSVFDENALGELFQLFFLPEALQGKYGEDYDTKIAERAKTLEFQIPLYPLMQAVRDFFSLRATVRANSNGGSQAVAAVATQAG